MKLPHELQAARGISTVSRAFGALSVSLLIFMLLTGAAHAGIATIRIVDDASGDGLGGVRVYAHEVVGETETVKVSGANTDASGYVAFDLPGLDGDARYVFKAKPYADWITSAEIEAPQSIEWRVGRVAIRIIDGVSGDPLPDQDISVRVDDGDGNYPALMSALSDAQGWIRIDPPNLGAVPLVIRARSPVDGGWKYSSLIWGPFKGKFRLGNEPIAITLENGASGEPLANEVVTALERLQDGRLVERVQRTTNEAGVARFDLDGVGNGRTYLMRAAPYGSDVVTGEISLAGDYRLAAGTLEVAVENGANGEPFRRVDIELLEVLGDGSRRLEAIVKTDGNGVLRLQPPQLGQKRYTLRAASPSDGTPKYSEIYEATGAYRFVVGNAALTVKIIDSLTGNGMPGVRVYAHEVLSNGDTVKRERRDTDAAGGARFDLEGLGEGRNYVLKAKPFDHWISSETLVEPHWFSWRAGRLAVQVVDGTSGAPLVGETVGVRRISDDGTYPAVMEATTDALGWIRVDPPGLGTDALAVRAFSPTDGRWKYSRPIYGAGIRQFEVGNEAVSVQLVNGVTGEGLASENVTVLERKDDGKLTEYLSRVTDGSGRVLFDLDGLGEGRTYRLSTSPYDHTVETDDISQPGNYTLVAGSLEVLIEDGTSGNAYQYRDVDILEVDDTGTRSFVQRVRTDVEGLIQLDPEALGDRRYVIRAPSLADGSAKFSAIYAAPGRYRFVVGNAAAVVRLIDDLSGDGMPGKRVHAHRILADGTTESVASRDTDDDGVARFDLDGFDDGERYVFKAKPFSHWLTSEETDGPGTITWRVGRLAVELVDGVTGLPVANQEISIRERSDDGSFPLVMNSVSDTQGLVRLDPHGFGQRPLVLRARSPVDGHWKYSSPVWSSGLKRFKLGNPAIAVTLLNGASGSAVANVPIEAWERTESGQTRLRATRESNSAGAALFDLDGLHTGRRYFFRASPYDSGVQSADVTEYGEVVLTAGSLEVALVNGVNGSPFDFEPVELVEVEANGNKRLAAEVRTDSDGIVRLQPDAFGQRQYLLRARSPSDGSIKTSATFSEPGQYEFVVGNSALTVKLIDAVSDTGIGGVPVYAHEILADGSSVKRARRDTDEAGGARFDLDGLGSGRRYVLKARPYEHWLTSEPLTAPQWFGWRVNTMPITILNAADGGLLVGKLVYAYEKTSTGELRRIREATSDATGTVHFDLGEIDADSRFVFRIDDPFSAGGVYYSPLVIGSRPTSVSIASGSFNRPDLNPPSLTIDTPGVDGTVGNYGFTLTGAFGDEQRVERIDVRVLDGDLLVAQERAVLNRLTNQWSAEFTELGNVLPGSLSVSVVAIDESANQKVSTSAIDLVEDATPPVITVSSHAHNERVSDGGFVVAGHAHDDIGATTLSTRLLDDDGSLIDERDVPVNPETGRWAYTVFAREAMPTGSIIVELRGTDDAGNTGVESIELRPRKTAREQWVALGRIGFGANPGQLDMIRNLGLDAYINQQLAPFEVDDSEYESRRQAYLTGDPAAVVLERASLSRRQLLEVMTWFWDNHFNTSLTRHPEPVWEIEENTAFRTHALGRFRDLLDVSAHSPAMLRYLDGALNVARAPNENYARELLELHTVGTDQDTYTETDVATIARAFTGWTIAQGGFFFDAEEHDNDPKTVLGEQLHTTGAGDGEAVLDILARHPATAKHICDKLIDLFVGPNPPTALAVSCQSRFLDTGDAPDQIASVLGTILHSTAFRQSLLRRDKVRTPIELVVASMRNLEANPDMGMLSRQVAKLGMELFHNPVPTGYAERNAAWVSTDSLLDRMRYLRRVVQLHGDFDDVVPDLADHMTVEGYESADAIAGELLGLFVGPGYSRADWERVRAALTSGGDIDFELVRYDAEARLRDAALVAISLPEYQMQ